jgi:hypothetical protein
MKRLLALCGALVLTLAMAAPAAADQRVRMFDDPFAEYDIPVSIAAGWDFECTGNVWYSIEGRETLVLWFANGADPATDPWIRGQYRNRGTDYFSDARNLGGTVVSGKYVWKSHLFDLVPGDPATWREIVTGVYWGIQHPGAGTVFHESGNWKQTVEAFSDDPEWVYTQTRDPRGNATFDVDDLCGAFGYDAVLAP